MKIGFIGAGAMGQAMIEGLLRSGMNASDIQASTQSFESSQRIAAKFGIVTTLDNEEVAMASDVVFICVKPDKIREVCELLLDRVPAEQLQRTTFVSIAAGVPKCKIRDWLNGHPSVATAMPNLPVAVNEGVIALFGNDLRPALRHRLLSVLERIGLVCPVKNEVELAYLVGIAGSAPAYYYSLVEQIETAAGQYSLSNSSASDIIRQTTKGSLTLLSSNEFDAKSLKERVVSPNGTTEQALNVLESGDVENRCVKAMEAAVYRTMEQLSAHLNS